jgi:DNA helicase-2/ATP-dependent DNA helicase PcrA
LIDLSKTQKDILAAGGNLLIVGGPGSGKTTVAILKAAEIARTVLYPGQKILFLSFARATVSRVIEAIDEEEGISSEIKKRIEVETYHAFFWRILKTHGYLLGLPRRMSLMTPPNEGIALAAIRTDYKRESQLSEAELAEKRKREAAERLRLAMEEGRLCFSIFASLAGSLLGASDKIRRLVSNAFPFVILDEFQDTSGDQWDVVKALGTNSTLVALADPEQRIFDFIGADPKRLGQFKELFKPTEFQLGDDNHRSKGTDIVQFGNDVLAGKFRTTGYKGVEVVCFEPNPNQALSSLTGHTLKARERLIKAKKARWSVAILVPTRRMTRQVSESLQNPLGNLPAIIHSAAIDMEAAILAAEIIACLLEPQTNEDHFTKFVELLCGYYRGKGGDAPSQASLNEADRLRAACTKLLAAQAKGKPPATNSIAVPLTAIYEEARAVVLVGDPDADWTAIRGVLEAGHCPRLKEVGEEVKNIRLLDRGTQLRQALAQDWRTFGSYRNALAIIQAAFVQEHFSTAHKPETGVVVMNMHKAKGKQFDEVIIFEGWPKTANRKIVANPDRIVRGNERADDMSQARQTFRVSVTRAKTHTTILTPKNDPCVLLIRE